LLSRYRGHFSPSPCTEVCSDDRCKQCGPNQSRHGAMRPRLAAGAARFRRKRARRVSQTSARMIQTSQISSLAPSNKASAGSHGRHQVVSRSCPRRVYGGRDTTKAENDTQGWRRGAAQNAAFQEENWLRIFSAPDAEAARRLCRSHPPRSITLMPMVLATVKSTTTPIIAATKVEHETDRRRSFCG